MTQSADLQKGLVRILADGGEMRRVVGAGFLVSLRHILTCAHVVADALGIPEDAPAAPTAPVWLDWPLVADSAPMSAQVACWHPVKAEARRGELEDIAVLELDGEQSLPGVAQPVPVVVVEEQAFFERPVRMYGFAEDRGDWVNGQLQGPVATGWVQLDHELGRLCVAPGFSGTAVWDKRENAAVGMIVSIATRENVRSAYMIPVASLIRAWPTLDAHSRPPNPYRGLEAFREQDARYFMGRDDDIQDLLALLQQRPFVALVGASGSGKSSLLFAGVVPQLRKQGCWLIADFRPRGDPFRELATALTLLLYPGLDELERLEKRKQLVDKLNGRSLNLADVVDLLLRNHPGKRLLLIADQFEELYTQNLAPERQRQFVDELVAAVRAQGKKPAFTLLLALRVDFLGQALDYEPLAEWIKSNHLLLGPLGQAGLETAIENPAQQLGVKLEEGLAERILQDLGQEPGALPLLEFALTQLWERQQYRQLTHAAYEAIGGVTQALARHADETLARFQDEREKVRRVFVQLVRPGEGTEDTRQVATREQVGADNWTLVTELADERLVVTGRDTQGQETVEVVHEALLRHWQPLRQWIEQDRQFRVWQNRLRSVLQEWQEQSRDEGALLRGARLAEAEERLSKHADELSQAEKEYIKASIALREREEKERGIQRQKELQMIQQLAEQRNAALSAQAEVEQQRDEANKQRNLTLARQLAAQAALRLDNTGTGLVQSTLLATESLQRDLTMSGYMILVRTIDLLPRHKPIRLPHENTVLGATFNPDGQRLATASWDNTARVWDAASGQELTLLSHEGWVLSVAFSPDGQRLATASWDNTVRVWDATNGQELVRLSHEDIVNDVMAFSPDGQRLATSSVKAVRIWAVASGQELVRLSHEARVRSIAFSPDGQRLATASDDKTVRVWDAASGQELVRLSHEYEVRCVAFSPDGQRLATASNDKTARVWDATSGRALARLSHEYEVRCVIFSPDGQRLATASNDKTARVWDAASGQELARLSHEGWVLSVAFSPNSRQLATASGGDAAWVWDATSSRELVRLAHEDKVQSAAFSPDGQRLATASSDHTARVWDLISGQELARLSHKNTVWSVAFSPDSRRLATASQDHTARVWDAANGRELARLSLEGAVLSVTFSPDGWRLATASEDHTARVWDSTSGQELTRLTHENRVSSVAFSPDSQRLATTSEDNTARVWDLASNQELTRLFFEGWVWSMAFSPDGRRLATASRDKMARVWDVASGRELARLSHENAVLSVAFSPDGQWLATASDDKTARVWDVTSGRELAWLAHESKVQSIAFSPDGQRLATVSADDMARVWLWRTEDLIAEACKRLPRNLTHQEWRQFVGEEVPYHVTCPNLPVPEG